MFSFLPFSILSFKTFLPRYMIMDKWVNIMSKFDKYRWKLENATKIEKRKVKNKKLILKPFIVSRDETDKFEKKELEKTKKRKKM